MGSKKEEKQRLISQMDKAPAEVIFTNKFLEQLVHKKGVHGYTDLQKRFWGVGYGSGALFQLGTDNIAFVKPYPGLSNKRVIDPDPDSFFAQYFPMEKDSK